MLSLHIDRSVISLYIINTFVKQTSDGKNETHKPGDIDLLSITRSCVGAVHGFDYYLLVLLPWNNGHDTSEYCFTRALIGLSNSG